MSNPLRQHLDALKDEIEHAGARPQAIDAMIADMQGPWDRDGTAALLSLLSDGAVHDEGMFSIIHAAEAANDDAYVEALLSIFDGLSREAPRWASIVLMRVLNNDAARRVLIGQVREALESVKGSIRDMCERINGVSPEFLSRTTPAILAAR